MISTSFGKRNIFVQSDEVCQILTADTFLKLLACPRREIFTRASSSSLFGPPRALRNARPVMREKQFRLFHSFFIHSVLRTHCTLHSDPSFLPFPSHKRFYSPSLPSLPLVGSSHVSPNRLLNSLPPILKVRRVK